MSIEVKYIDSPVGVQQDAVISSSGAQSFSESANLSLGVKDRPWASLESSFWKLDGTLKIIDPEQDLGWWSDKISGSDGYFASCPVISMTFGSPYSSTGFTFSFSPSTKQWCSEVDITWLRGGSIIDSGTFYPDRAEWTLERTVKSFDMMRVQLKRTNIPNRFARVTSIRIGRVVWFGHDELISVSLLNEMDPSCCRLPVDTMKINIRDRNDRDFLPQTNQRMELYKNGSLLAAHYITDAAREDNARYSFSCQSAVGLLEDEFLGGIYDKVPVAHLLDDILDGREYELGESFRTKTLSGYLPVSTRREALQQVALAIGAVVSTYGSDKICLDSLSEEISGVFTGGDIFPGAKLQKAPRVAEVSVTVHKYTPSTEREELVSEEYYSSGTYIFTFSEPHHSYRVEGEVTGNGSSIPGTVLDSGANWVKVEVSGTMSITAAKYTHSEKLYTKQDPLAAAAERGNVLSVSEATLITESNAEEVLERLYDSAKYRNTLTQDAVIKDQKAGDIGRARSPWGSDIEGFIVSMDSTFTRNGHTAGIKLIGEEASS